MGVYDILPNGSQLKCWKCEMKKLTVGSRVGKLQGKRSYIVVLREGGYVEVRRGKIVKILEDRQKHHIVSLETPMFDKFGNRVYDTNGLKDYLGSDYYY